MALASRNRTSTAGSTHEFSIEGQYYRRLQSCEYDHVSFRRHVHSLNPQHVQIFVHCPSKCLWCDPHLALLLIDPPERTRNHSNIASLSPCQSNTTRKQPLKHPKFVKHRSNERNSLARPFTEKDIGIQTSPTTENVRSPATTDSAHPLLSGTVTTMGGQEMWISSFEADNDVDYSKDEMWNTLMRQREMLLIAFRWALAKQISSKCQ